jgi:hypothetical protein
LLYEKKVQTDEINVFYGQELESEGSLQRDNSEASMLVQKQIEAEIADTLVKTAETGGTIEYYISTKRIKEYFYSHSPIEWNLDNVKLQVEKLPKLSYVCALKNFLSQNGR